MRRLLPPLALTISLFAACGEDDPGPNRPEPSDGAADAAANDAASASDAGPALSLTAALDVSGVNPDIERAFLVAEAACKKLVSCGLLMSEALCKDETLMDWTVGSLFFAPECLDAQLDRYSCWAKSECGGQGSCSPLRETEDALCVFEE